MKMAGLGSLRVINRLRSHIIQRIEIFRIVKKLQI